MKRALIHIGNLKTGSTAIQRVLCTLRPDLAARGILMPGLDEAVIAHHAINQDYGKPGTKAPRTAAIFAAVAAAPEGSTLLLTAETFMAVPPDWLKARLAEGGCTEFKVLAYVRPHISMMGSLYLQNVKNGIFLGSASEHLALLRGAPLRFMEVIDAYGRTFGDENVIVREFTRSVLRGGSVVTDFWDMMALPDDMRARAAEAEEMNNPTPSAELALLLRAASNFLIEEAPPRQREAALEGDRNSEFRKAIRFLFARLSDATDKLPDTRYRLPLDLQVWMNRHFEAERAAFAKAWFREPPTASWLHEEPVAPGPMKDMPFDVLREVVQQANQKLKKQDATPWARRMRAFMAKLPRGEGEARDVVRISALAETFGLTLDQPVKEARLERLTRERE